MECPSRRQEIEGNMRQLNERQALEIIRLDPDCKRKKEVIKILFRKQRGLYMESNDIMDLPYEREHKSVFPSPEPEFDEELDCFKNTYYYNHLKRVDNAYVNGEPLSFE